MLADRKDNCNVVRILEQEPIPVWDGSRTVSADVSVLQITDCGYVMISSPFQAPVLAIRCLEADLQLFSFRICLRFPLLGLHWLKNRKVLSLVK